MSKTIEKRINEKNLRALNKLHLMPVMRTRIESVYDVKISLKRYGLDEELLMISRDNIESQNEMIDRFLTF